MADRTTLPPRDLLACAGAVAVGGAVGSLCRVLALRLQPATTSSSWTDHIPVVLLIVNVLGVLGATWALRRPLRHREPNDLGRLLVVTGFFGGFTSYSSLLVALATLWHLSVWGSLVTGLTAVLSGALGAWLVVRLVKR